MAERPYRSRIQQVRVWQTCESRLINVKKGRRAAGTGATPRKDSRKFFISGVVSPQEVQQVELVMTCWIPLKTTKVVPCLSLSRTASLEGLDALNKKGLGEVRRDSAIPPRQGLRDVAAT